MLPEALWGSKRSEEPSHFPRIASKAFFPDVDTWFSGQMVSQHLWWLKSITSSTQVWSSKRSASNTIPVRISLRQRMTRLTSPPGGAYGHPRDKGLPQANMSWSTKGETLQQTIPSSLEWCFGLTFAKTNGGMEMRSQVVACTTALCSSDFPGTNLVMQGQASAQLEQPAKATTSQMPQGLGSPGGEKVRTWKGTLASRMWSTIRNMKFAQIRSNDIAKLFVIKWCKPEHKFSNPFLRSYLLKTYAHTSRARTTKLPLASMSVTLSYSSGTRTSQKWCEPSPNCCPLVALALRKPSSNCCPLVALTLRKDYQCMGYRHPETLSRSLDIWIWFQKQAELKGNLFCDES